MSPSLFREPPYWQAKDKELSWLTAFTPPVMHGHLRSRIPSGAAPVPCLYSEAPRERERDRMLALVVLVGRACRTATRAPNILPCCLCLSTTVRRCEAHRRTLCRGDKETRGTRLSMRYVIWRSCRAASTNSGINEFQHGMFGGIGPCLI